MANRTRIPRASFSVGIVADADYRALRKMTGGGEAWGDFAALVIVAKAQDNGGKFAVPLEIVADWIGTKPGKLTRSINLIQEACRRCGNRPWIAADGGTITVRNFDKWNGQNPNWGGPRSASNMDASCNQDGTESEASCLQLDAPLQEETDTETDTGTDKPISGARKPREPDPIWDAVAAIWFADGIPKRMASRVGAVVRDLRGIGATAETIRARHRNALSRGWRDITAEKFVELWSQLASPKPFDPHNDDPPEKTEAEVEALARQLFEQGAGR